MCIRIVDKTESAALNETFRGKKGPTNILSFHYDDIALPSTNTLGDLACCAEIIESEATQQHKTIQAHWQHMLVHGILHLLGYDHEQPTEAEIMEQLEIHILQQLNVSNPYAD
jgi:probable rRNA maturation factor